MKYLILVVLGLSFNSFAANPAQLECAKGLSTSPQYSYSLEESLEKCQGISDKNQAKCMAAGWQSPRWKFSLKKSEEGCKGASLAESICLEGIFTATNFQYNLTNARSRCGIVSLSDAKCIRGYFQQDNGSRFEEALESCNKKFYDNISWKQHLKWAVD